MNPKLMREAGFGPEMKRVRRNLCPFCAKPVDEKDFKDEISRREYRITGLCQKCQDEESKEEE